MVLLLAAGALPSVLVREAFAVGPCGTNGDFTAPNMCTYGATGSEDTFSVPLGVSSVHVVAVGARGGASPGCYPPGGAPGGFGAVVSAEVPVGSLSLSTLYVEVGGPGATNSTCSSSGSAAGGFNGGGAGANLTLGGDFTVPGGGGGGATDVRSVSRATSGTLTSRLVIAGGGGGGGGPLYSAGGAGGAADAPGGNGGASISCCSPGLGGGAGTSIAGGAGGAGCYSGGGGTEGVGGAGGQGCPPYSPGGGGGGGGGYFGGGGGGAGTAFAPGGGGGGGSSAAVSPATLSAPVATDGTGIASVTITWSTDGTTPTTTIALGPSEPDGDNDWYVSDVSVAVAADDGAGGSGVAETRCVLDPPTAPASFDDLAAGCPYTGAGADVTADGEHTLFAASRDEAGNEETPVGQSFKIDQTAPEVLTFTGVTAPEDGYLAADTVNTFPATVGAEPVDLNGDVSDATSGVASVDVNGVDATLGSWSVNGVALSPGVNTLTATATDAAGNSTQVSVSVTLDRDPDDDGIANNVDQSPGTTSSVFSDSALSGTGLWPTTGTVLSIPPGATLAIVDAPAPGAGVQVTVTTLFSGDRVRIRLAGKASIIRLAAGTHILTDPDLETTVEVTSGPGPAEIELTLNGSPILITIADGAAATITETISGTTLTALVVEPLTGTVTLNGEALATGQAVALGALSAKLSVSGASFNLSGTFTPGPSSDGLHPLTDDVSLRIGAYTFPIPAGSFTTASDGAYSFTGTVAGVRLAVQLKPAKAGRWTLKANGKPVSGLTNPVSLSLRVGDDMGVKTVSASLRS